MLHLATEEKMNSSEECPNRNEIAFRLCKNHRKALIFTKKDEFCPSPDFVFDFKDSIFICTEEDIFGVLEQHFDDFDDFILVCKTPNNFEAKMLEKIGKRSDKRILFVNENGKIGTTCQI